MFTASRIQAVTYLLGVCLFSISFLVFLNSSISFVVTDLIGERQGVGNAVGTLGFADELVVLVACPVWGMVSDRWLGVRLVSFEWCFPSDILSRSMQVCVLGYAIVGVALILSVQAKNVYPQLLLARLFFSIGGAATSTMVTAILPSMTAPRNDNTTYTPPGTAQQANGHTVSPSISSELTITPQRLNQQESLLPPKPALSSSNSSPTRLAGFVGLFTGCGALLALGVFLPLPVQFQKAGVATGQAVADAYYIVAATALLISVLCLWGLRDLLGEESKGWRALVQARTSEDAISSTSRDSSFLTLLPEAVSLGYQNPLLGLGYIGGFVARASSVGISLFIPLFVNAYFISSGLCDEKSGRTEDMKKRCRGAYILAAELTGISQLVALLFAPVFGYLGDRYRRYNIPLLIAALAGVLGYSALALLGRPEPTGAHGSPWIFVIVALLGISQIGAIVCSLGLVGRVVLESTKMSQSHEDDNIHQSTSNTYGSMRTPPRESSNPPLRAEIDNTEGTRGLLQDKSMSPTSRQHLKGSIAGIYSLAGGFGILLLTKLGGYLFDSTSPVAPFYMLSIFNAVLLVAGIFYGISAVEA